MKITKEDVGRKVVLRNGDLATIVEFALQQSYPVEYIRDIEPKTARFATSSGCHNKQALSDYDIVAFQEEEKPKFEVGKRYKVEGGPSSVKFATITGIKLVADLTYNYDFVSSGYEFNLDGTRNNDRMRLTEEYVEEFSVDKVGVYLSNSGEEILVVGLNGLPSAPITAIYRSKCKCYLTTDGKGEGEFKLVKFVRDLTIEDFLVK